MDRRTEIIDFKKVSNIELRKAAVARRKRKMMIKRIRKIGLVLGVVAGLGVTGSFISKKMEPREAITADSLDNNTNVDSSLDDEYLISAMDTSLDMNVVLVDDGIGSTKLENVKDGLESLGLDVDTRSIDNLNSNGTETFISLTSYKGEEAKVIGNYNAGNSQADLLALSMVSSLKEGNITGFDIQRGVHQYSDGITKMVPSDIEKKTDGSMIPTVTIAVPEDKDMDAISIAQGLARYNDYFEKGNSVYDANYLLRLNPGENVTDEVRFLNGMSNSDNGSTEVIYLASKLPKMFDPAAKVLIVTTIDNTNTSERTLK